MKLHTLTTLGAIAIAGILISSPASAFEWGSFPGANCKPYFGSQTGDFDFTNRSIRSRSTSYRWVVCPIVSYNNTNYSGGGPYEHVEVSHRLPIGTGENIRCYVYNRTNGGNSYNFGSAIQGSATTSRTMLINTNKRNSTSYQTLQCLLPPRGELNSYDGIKGF